MEFSEDVARALVDLIENKLAVMHIGNRDDLRERVLLQHCLAQIRARGDATPMIDIPHRGRHRKVADLMEDISRQTA